MDEAANETNEQLQRLAAELETARLRAHQLAAGTNDTLWVERPHEGKWSMSECITHLTLTTRGYLQLIRQALADGRELPPITHGRYRHDFIGWLLCKGQEPPVRLRIKTTAPFVPDGARPRAATMSEFDTSQNELMALVLGSVDVDLGKLQITSPFDSRLHYNLYSGYAVLAAHQRRHLWQAERAAEELAARGPD